MNPDVTLNFIANIMLGVGMLMLFPIRPGVLKRAGLIGIAIAAALNVGLMIKDTHRLICPSELLLNCCIAYYVTVLVMERHQHRPEREK